MRTYQILFDPEANGGRGEALAHMLDQVFPEDELVYRDYSLMATALDMVSFLSGDDCLVVCGGADTLSRFRSETEGLTFANEVKCLSPEGVLRAGGAPVMKSMSELVFVSVNGRSLLLNEGLSFGVTDRGPASNFSRVMRFKPFDAFVWADGSGNNFGSVWQLDVVPVKGAASLTCSYGFGKLRALKIVPAIMKGGAEKYEDILFSVSAKKITVELDRPADITIDGKTHAGVEKFTVTAG